VLWNHIGYLPSKNLIGNKVEENIGGILEILDSIGFKSDEYDFSDYSTTLPDYLDYGDEISLFCKEKSNYKLVMSPLELMPDDGCQDLLTIKLLGRDGEIVARGNIEILYGYVNFNDEGNIEDGCAEEITYYTEAIVVALEDIVDEFEKYVDGETGLMESLKETYEL